MTHDKHISSHLVVLRAAVVLEQLKVNSMWVFVDDTQYCSLMFFAVATDRVRKVEQQVDADVPEITPSWISCGTLEITHFL